MVERSERNETQRVLARAAALRQLRTPALARSMRIQAGLSLRDVARAMGVTPPAILKWERGEVVPAGDRAAVYVDFLRRACGDGEVAA